MRGGADTSPDPKPSRLLRQRSSPHLVAIGPENFEGLDLHVHSQVEKICWQYRKRIASRRGRRSRKPDWHTRVICDLSRLLRHRGSDRLIEAYLRNPAMLRYQNKDDLGVELELTFAERKALGITSIRPHDVDWRECRRLYKADRNRRKREAARAARLAAGAAPRHLSLAQTKPWEADGISRSTWFRRRKNAGETVSCHPSSIIDLRDQSVSSSQDHESGFAEGASPSTESNAFHFPPSNQEPAMRPLHDYQSEAFCDLRTTIRQGARRIMVQSPTGSGKTRLSAEIVDSSLQKGNKVAFVVPAIALIDQTVESFYSEGIRGIGVIQANHPMTDWSQPVQIASVQTLQSRGAFPEANTVIFDEAHRLFEAHKKWLTHSDWQAVPFIGLSATPWARGLGKYFTTLLKVTSTRDLINRGFLCPFRVFSTGHPDLSAVKLVAGDYHEGQLSSAMQEGSLTADIVQTYKERWGKGKTLCFAVDKAHARHLQERFEAAGIPCGYQDAETTGDERKEIKRKFHNGEYEVVCNIQTLTTGVDWKVDCLILARPTKSEMLFVQIVGRALRTDPDNSEKVALILDHSDTTSRLGFVTDIDHDELDDGKPRDKAAKQKEKSEPLPKECLGCSYLMPARSRECPNCASPVRPECTVFEADGELHEIVPGQLKKVGTKKNWSYEEQKVFLSELKGYGMDKGYRPGWAAAKYKDKFGMWPLRSMDSVPAAGVISSGTLSYIRSRNIAWAKSKATSQAAE